MADEKRTPILYLAPWVDFGGTDKGTIDWFKWLDRERFAPSLITTQPSLNRRIAEVIPYAEEVWPAPDFFAGKDLPKIIFDFIQTRGVEVLHIMNSRMGFDLLPDLAALFFVRAPLLPDGEKPDTLPEQALRDMVTLELDAWEHTG